MENTEIMNNEVIEATEEIVETGMSKGVKVAAGIGLTVVVGVIAYKYVAKPVIAKIRAEIEQRKAKDNVIEIQEEDLDDSDED